MKLYALIFAAYALVMFALLGPFVLTLVHVAHTIPR